MYKLNQSYMEAHLAILEIERRHSSCENKHKKDFNLRRYQRIPSDIASNILLRL